MIKYIFKTASNIENIEVKKHYYKFTKIPLILNNVDISLIKNKMLGNYMNLSLDEAIKKINVPNTDIEIKLKDIKYKLKLIIKD